MYSVVLMVALTSGSATPDWHRYGGCCGCYSGCYGCGGGCYGGCYGCGGGCFGGGYGDGHDDGYGAPPSPGSMVPGDGMIGHGDGYGAPTYPGSIVPGNGMIAPGTGVYPGSTGTPTGQPLGTPTENKGKDRDKNGQGMLSATKAQLVVELPAGAKLFVDDIPVKATEGLRTFDTPALEPGQPYYYMVRIEMMQDGKPVSETRRIIVRAGQVSRADFNNVASEDVRTTQAK